MAGELLPAAQMTENKGPDSLEANLRRLMNDHHLYGYHVRISTGSAAGWPDWVIIGPNGVLFRELKSQQGTLSVDQRHVGSMLGRQGLNWAVWRPQHLHDGTIQNQLGEIAAHKQGSLI